MKYVDHSGKVDLRDWCLHLLLKPLEQEFTEAVELALKEIATEAYLYFPIEWENSDGLGGSVVDTPTTLYLRLPFNSEGEMPTWKFDLEQTVADAIGLHTNSNGIVEGGRKGLEALRGGLRTLTETIDGALND